MITRESNHKAVAAVVLAVDLTTNDNVLGLEYLLDDDILGNTWVLPKKYFNGNENTLSHISRTEATRMYS